MMDAGGDDNILGLFIDEAEEIVQQLTGLLDELHYGYDGERILDDIHRGFHTLKGGASVIGGLNPLEECSDLAEQVMDSLRAKRLTLNPGLVSLIGGALAAIEGLLAEMRSQGTMSPLPEELLERLLKTSGRLHESTGYAGSQGGDGDPLDLFFGDITVAAGQEGEAGLLNIPGEPTISDEEFESILDNLYGEGRGPTGSRAENHLAALTVDEPPEPEVVQDSLPAFGDDRLRDEQIKNLVKELAWVRTRLMRLKNQRSREDTEKALSYLDLVTRDMERWVREGSSSGED